MQDTGVGIPPDRLPLIFDMFFQGEPPLDRAQGGLGIGLTVAKRLVELHGGTLTAASGGADRGSTFTVRLPATKSAGATGDGAGATSRGVPRRVLVVEDNTDAREMLKMALELGGHTVHEAADGLEGVERAIALRPDAALIDIGLPGVDGYEVARRLRCHPAGAEMLLIAVTGYGQPDDRRRSQAAGFDAHLVKPVSPEELERIVTAAARAAST